MEIRELRDFSLVYSVKVRSPTAMIRCESSPQQQQQLYILEAASSENKADGAIDQIRLRCISEAQPSVLLSRLLAKSRFEEAEELARRYKLDLQLVYSTKANYLVAHGSLTELLACLAKIESALDVARFARSASLSDVRANMELLAYGERRLDAASNRESEALRCEIRQLRQKLTTFVECIPESAMEWTEFCRSAPEEILTRMLKEDIDRAQLFWLRTPSIKRLSPERLGRILAAIPESLLFARVIPLIEACVLPEKKRRSETEGSVCAWIEARICAMEYREAERWPMNASEACSRLAIQELASLANGLAALVSLHTLYKCRLSWVEFSRETCESVAYRILDRAQSPEEVPSAIRNFAKPYMLENKLQVAPTLHRYLLVSSRRMLGALQATSNVRL